MIEKSAVISPCGTYRYRLWRKWAEVDSMPVMWLMLNPSTADGKTDDPTIKRCMKFSAMWGYGAMWVGNLFAFRSTDPHGTRAPLRPSTDRARKPHSPAVDGGRVGANRLRLGHAWVRGLRHAGADLNAWRMLAPGSDDVRIAKASACTRKTLHSVRSTPCELQTVTIRRPVLRYHGGKFRLSSWIRSFFPPHQVYVEPFGGAGSVLLTKERAYAEVYNDLDGEVVNFFRVLRDPVMRDRLCELCSLTPFSREEFENSYLPTTDPVESARNLAIRAGMGYGSSGGTKTNTGFRIDSGRKWSTDFAQWRRYPDTIAAVADRLLGVLIENRPATSVMLQHDGPVTLHYVDPPYLFSVRARATASIGSRYYRHEMTDWQHMDMLAALRNLQGMVVLSGFHSPMYAEQLADWSEYSCNSRGNARRGSKVNREFVWLNAACAAALEGKEKTA